MFFPRCCKYILVGIEGARQHPISNRIVIFLSSRNCFIYVSLLVQKIGEGTREISWNSSFVGDVPMEVGARETQRNIVRFSDFFVVLDGYFEYTKIPSESFVTADDSCLVHRTLSPMPKSAFINHGAWMLGRSCSFPHMIHNRRSHQCQKALL